jgi:2-polyprenyl-6-methoxyphenol hydroxylase-like FAD-dependent oxidoreductase
MRTPREEAGVLIVGAGPTGLTAAMELSRLGVPVRIIDRAAAPSTTSRALAVQARTLELMEPRGVGADMVRLGNPARATALYGRGRRLAAVRLDRVPSRFSYVLMLAQSETERLLAEQLATQGVHVERGTEFVSLTQDAGGVDAVLRDAGGERELARCAYLIDASGAHSAVRHALDLPFTGRQLIQRYLLGDLYLDGAIPADEMSIFLADDGFAALFPMAGRRFRLIATDPGPDTPAGTEPTLEDLQRVYDRVSHIPVRMRDLVWSSRFRISSRHLATLRAGNVFFGGDAAHIHSPAGGQGMNTGIQDMVNLCWKLALVIGGRAAPDLLDTYEAERLPVVTHLVRTTERATQLFNSTSPLVHRALSYLAPLALGRDRVQARAATTVGQVGVSYRGGPLAAPPASAGGRHPGDLHPGDLHPGDLHPGDRVPDLELTAGGRPARLYQLLDLAGLTLLVTTPEPPAHVRDAFGPWSGLVTIHPVAVTSPAADAPAGDARIAAGLSREPSLLLLRPDGHLAAAAPASRPGPVTGWLTRWCPPPASAVRSAEAAHLGAS